VQQTTAAANNSQRATLDMSGLSTRQTSACSGGQAARIHNARVEPMHCAWPDECHYHHQRVAGFEVGNNTTGRAVRLRYLGQNNTISSFNINIGRRKP
jgi:hypothetical protein